MLLRLVLRVVFIQFFLGVITCGEKSNTQPFYDDNDDVTVLNADNFRESVINSSSSWFVMFYSQWCGHCRVFSPVYKRLAADMKGWNGFFKLAAYDCAGKSPSNEDNGSKVCFKKPYYVGGMPDCRFFPPFSSEDFEGLRRPFKGRKIYGSDGRVKEDTDSFEKVRESVVGFLHDNSFNDSASVHFGFLKKQQVITEFMNKQEKHLVFVIEPRSSITGKLIILDVTSSCGDDVIVRRVSSRNQKAMSEVRSLFKVEFELPAPRTLAWIFAADGGSEMLEEEDGKPGEFREKVVQAIRSLSGIEKKTDADAAKVVGLQDQQTPGQEEALIRKVYMDDLEAALHYALRKEVAGRKETGGDALDSLKLFVSTLTKFFPGRKPVMKYLRKVRKLLAAKKKVMSWDDWHEIIERADKTKGSELPSAEEYVGCSGTTSSAHRHPCALWQLFHVTMTQYHRTAPDMDPMLVLRAISGYVGNFFTCMECRTNWERETGDVDAEVRDSSSALMYLWRKHNSVTRRVKGQHRARDWPPEQLCEDCWTSDAHGRQVFDEPAVERFLAQFYAHDRISYDSDRDEESEERDGKVARDEL